MRLFRLSLLIPLSWIPLTSCMTTSVEQEFADFEPILRSTDESQQDKAMRMFGAYDPSKVSNFQGKEYSFGKGNDANVRRSIEKKEYNGGDHPYFKLREKGFFSDKKAYRTKAAREGSMVAEWEDTENSWFKKIFSKKESRLGSSQVARKDFRLPKTSRAFSERNAYERKDYPVEIIDDPDREKKISRGTLGSLLNF